MRWHKYDKNFLRYLHQIFLERFLILMKKKKEGCLMMVEKMTTFQVKFENVSLSVKRKKMVSYDFSK